LCSWEPVGTLVIPSTVHFDDYSSLSIYHRKANELPAYVAVSSQLMSQVWVGMIEEINQAPFFSLSSLNNNTIYDLPRTHAATSECRIKYCNLEGVAWQGEYELILVSDKAKNNQGYAIRISSHQFDDKIRIDSDSYSPKLLKIYYLQILQAHISLASYGAWQSETIKKIFNKQQEDLLSGSDIQKEELYSDLNFKSQEKRQMVTIKTSANTMYLSDEVIYVCLLLVSIPIGFLFKNSRHANLKAYSSTLIGFIFALIVCRWDVLHSLVTTSVTCLILAGVTARYVHIATFVWCFSYLLYFRTTDLFSIRLPVAHSNAIQLMLTLKLVGIAYEWHDSYTRLKTIRAQHKTDESEKLHLQDMYLSVKPSTIRVFQYAYCYIGLLTGPYYRYRTYHDWLEMKHGVHIHGLTFMRKRAIFGSIYILAYLLLSALVSFNDALDDKFYTNPLWYRLLYMPLVFTLFRCRFYSAWLLAECMCMSAGFGAYPLVSKPKPGQGPTDLAALKHAYEQAPNTIAYDFETIHNIDEWKCESAFTVKEVLRYWNMSVQYWMATCVYKRIKWRRIAHPATMFVSAYWHGIHLGYYMGMVSTTPSILAENAMEAGVRRRIPVNSRFIRVYDMCSWFFRTRMFDYMSIGFILKHFYYTWKYWKSVYFIGHTVTLILYLIGLIAIQIRPRGKRKEIVHKDLGIDVQPKAPEEQHQRLENEHKKEL
ncbi:unnamed protein product, partial [Rotaria socialis]